MLWLYMPNSKNDKLSGAEKHTDLKIPVGTNTVAATRYEPVDIPTPHPTILIYTPYRKDDFFVAGDCTIEFFVERGYEVVVADMVGTGSSTGLPSEPFSPKEGENAAEVIHWLADRKWSNGRIGMYGKSYPGVTAIKAAACKPEPLKAIIPIHAPDKFYPAYYNGGIFALYRTGGSWSPNFEWNAALPPSQQNKDNWSAIWEDRLDQLRERTPYLFQYLSNDEPNEYWREKEVPIHEIDTPTFAVTGWRDPFPVQMTNYYRELDCDKRIMIGPWRHEMPHTGQESAVDFHSHMLEWFDYYLKDEKEMSDWPNILYWTEENNNGEMTGTWRKANEWPFDDGKDITFSLSPNGLIDPEEFTQGEIKQNYEPDYTVGIDSFDMDIPGSSPIDTNADDARSLCYETDNLENAIELSGSGSFKMRFKPLAPNPTFVVRIIDLAPDGSANIVTHGEIEADKKNSTFIEEGVKKVTIPLKPKSHIFREEHKIRIAISVSFFPFILPKDNKDGFKLLSAPESPSNLSFPGKVHSGEIDILNSTELDDPNESYVDVTPDKDWRTKRDHKNDSATVITSESWTSTHQDMEMDYSEMIKASVQSKDASSAFLQKETNVDLNYSTSSIHLELKNRVSRDVAQMTSKVKIDDQIVFDETYTWHSNNY